MSKAQRVPTHPASAAMGRALARQLAPELKVMLVYEADHDPFDALQLFAEAEVKELVLVHPAIDPDTPAGQTAHGAPLRMRPDWRERPSSKDLILDLEGHIDGEDLSRLIKKAGIYVTATSEAPLDGLPHVFTLVPAPIVGWSLGEGPTVGAPDVSPTLLEGLHPVAGEPRLFLAGKQPIGDLPGLTALADGAEAAEALSHARQAAAEAQASGEATAQALAEAEARLKDQAEALATLQAQVEAQRQEIDEAEAAAEAAATELAERRIQDRRVDLAQARFDEARGALQREIDGLRDRLRETEPEQADRQHLAEARQAAQAAWGALAAQIHEAVTQLTGALRGTDTAVPPPPPAAAAQDLLDAWQEMLQGRAVALVADAGALAAERQRLQGALDEATARCREQAAALAALSPEISAEPSPVHVPLPEPDLQLRVEALERALAAERDLRADLERECDQARQAALQATTGLQRHLARTGALRAEAGRRLLAEAAAEDDAARARAEIGDRQRQIDDLEAMLTEYRRMIGLLSEGLEQAAQAREQAQSELSIVAGNLRILQGEFERHRAGEGLPEA